MSHVLQERAEGDREESLLRSIITVSELQEQGYKPIAKLRATEHRFPLLLGSVPLAHRTLLVLQVVSHCFPSLRLRIMQRVAS